MENEKNEKKEFNLVKEIVSFAKDMAICMVIVLVIMHFIARPIGVIGSSMYPTLEEGEVGLSDVIGYRLNGLDRFDIAIIYVEQKDEYLVKRVIGLPGETVSYTDGRLYIDGEYVEEDFLKTEYAETYDGVFMEDVEEITLGEDEYFCLGDNRPRSTDSRYYGPFKKDKIKCKGVFVLWPLNKIGLHTW